MPDLEVVGISLDARKAVAEAAALRRGLHKVDAQSERTARKTAKLSTAFDRTASRIKSLALAYVGLAAAQRAIGAGAAAIREHEQLAARLNTLAGSAKAGAAALAELTQFAAETPFALQESINAFARFRSVGITPTIAQMRHLGDFAAAMGANINDAAAAVVQGAFAETERLKSLAIATQVSSSEIRLAYDDVTRAIQRTGDAKTDAAAILAFVTDLGKSRFGNAMAEQMETVAGATSNLRDSLGLLAVEIGEGGFRKAWAQSTAGAAKLTSELTEQLRIARELAAAERRTLDLRSKAFQATRAATARGNELERNLLRHFRATPEQEAAALDVILGRQAADVSPAPGGPTGPPADRQFRLDELRATILEMTHGRETADQYRVSVAGTSAALVDQELALARARDGLVEHNRATEVAAQAEKTRQARLDAAIRSQERYAVLLTQGRKAASRLDFLALSPDAAQLDAWDALAKRIEAASTSTDTFTESGKAMRDAMRDAERRAYALEGAVAALLRTATSGGSILGALASVLQGHLINAVAGKIAGAIAPGATPIPTTSPITPTPTTSPVATATGDRSGGREPSPVVHFNQKLEVSAIDQRGVADFLEANRGAIGATVVRAIQESSTLRLGVQ